MYTLFQNGRQPVKAGASDTKTRSQGPTLRDFTVSTEKFSTNVSFNNVPFRSGRENMANALYGPRLLTEEDIPGSSLAGRKPSTLKNSELQFWLRKY